MSWSIVAAGTGAEVAPQAAAQFANAKYPGSEAQHPVLVALEAAVAAFSAQFPDQIVIAESGGHIDRHFGNATLTLRAIYRPPAPAPVAPPAESGPAA